METTIQQQLKKLKPAHRDAALTNMKPSGMTEKASDIGSAIALAFDWVDTPEGYTFWIDICHELIAWRIPLSPKKKARNVYCRPTQPSERTYPIYSGFIRLLPECHCRRVSLELQGQPAASPRQALSTGIKQSPSDELDALMRHMIDGDWEQVAWRAMGNLERKLTGCCQYTNNKLDK